MTIDTSKITNAANELSSGLTKGGTAAKTLGTEVASTLNSLDARISALEAGGGSGAPPPQGGQGDGPTGGLITQFQPQNGGITIIDGASYYGHTYNNGDAAKKKIDDHTIRYELSQGTGGWNNDVDVSDMELTERFRDGEAVTVAYRIMIEPGPENGADWFVCGVEWHNDDGQSGYATSPIFVSEILGEKFSIVHRSGSNAGNTKLERPWTQPQNFVRGQWYVFEFDVKPERANGYLRVKLDGEQIVDYSGPLGYGCDGYPMFGLYREAQPETFSAQIRNLTASWAARH
jgi:hypothetical protein